MHTKVLVFLLAILASNGIIAQQTFHRTYPHASGKDIISLNSTQLKDGNYVALELFLDRDVDNNLFSDTIIITSYKPKGDINWSKRIALDIKQEGIEVSDGSIFQGDNDSIYYTLTTPISSEKANKIIGSLDKGGAVGQVRAFTNIKDKVDGPISAFLGANFNKSIFSANVVGDETETGIQISRKTYDGANIYSKLLSAVDENGDGLSEGLNNLSIEADKTILLTGTVDSNNTASYLTVLDTLSKVKWSRRYSDEQAAFFGFPLSFDAARMKDSTYVFGGINVEITLAFDIIFRGFIIKTDKTGNIQWSKKIIFGDDNITFVKNITVDKNDNILIAGANGDATGNVYNFVTSIKPDGTVNWKKKYPRAAGILDVAGELFTTKDGGSALINYSTENDILKPSFIKLNDKGESSCEENIDEEIFFDNLYSADTLLWTSVDTQSYVTELTKKSTVNTYDVPFVSLEVRPFCPNEPIDWTFRVPIRGATNYKWSTGVEGPMLDSLRVFEEGEYSVMVTVGEGVCFVLCDTSKLARYDLPKAALTLSIGNFCANDKMTLTAGYQPGHPEVQSITWSTGETGVNSIEIASPGTYTVTIVDKCNESAKAEINTGPFPMKITTASVTGQVSVDCIDGTITGTLTAKGNSNGLGVERFLWSTGANTGTISINNSPTSTYTVTVIDGCGNTKTANYTVEFKGDGIKNVSISVDLSKVCFDKIIELNAITDRTSSKLTYAWSTGDSTPKISVKDQPGTYTVTVTDACGNTSTASRDLKKEDFVAQDLISDLKLTTTLSADCSLIDVGITFSPSNDLTKIKSFLWSTGETTSGITFTGKKTYSITVTDNCNKQYTASAEIDAPNVLNYAHVFFPSGVGVTLTGSGTATPSKQDTLNFEALVLNRSFGPINRAEYCLNKVTEYEFYVFNRWGQEVFKSTDIDEEWPGKTDGGKDWPSDTYVYVVRYAILGFPQKTKGDVTLIR